MSPTSPDSHTNPTPPTPATSTNIQQELQKYQQALKEEFETKTREIPEDTVEAARDYFRKNLALGMAQIVYLAQNAESETVRLNASKCIVSEALKEHDDSGDPIKKILKELMNPEAINDTTTK